ncbi:MAG: hypothetical protein KBT04_05300 [Bacteroidales bacterium]|nr:hypothetical protein [Candidatus Colimorpha onthohippi]
MRKFFIIMVLTAVLGLLGACNKKKNASEEAKNRAEQLEGTFAVKGRIYLDACVGFPADDFGFAGTANVTHKGNAVIRIAYTSDEGDYNAIDADIDGNGKITFDEFTVKKSGVSMSAEMTSSSLYAHTPDSISGEASCVLDVIILSRVGRLKLTAVRM